MITMTCNCGTTSATFQKLLGSDFPKGWETDCCLENKEVKAPIAKPVAKMAQDEALSELANISDEPGEVTHELILDGEPVGSNSLFIGTPSLQKPDFKKRGRKNR